MLVEPDHTKLELDSGCLDEAISLLAVLPDKHNLMQAILGLLRRWTGCEAVGVRLRQGEDYPYFITTGFSKRFVAMENSLCAVDAMNAPVRDASGRLRLECLCGAVLSGHTDPSLPFFTAKGSFFTGSTSALLARAWAVPLPVVTRNRCNAVGYETVILTPLRAGGETFGLLQINDRHVDRLNRLDVERLERLADGVAMLLSRQEMEEALRAAEARYRAMFFANVAVKLLIDPRSGRILDANPAACDFYGYDLDVMRRLCTWDINTLPEEQVRREMARAEVETQRSFRSSHRLADGQVREVEVYSSPVEYSGRIVLFSIVHDITARVQAEESRERVEQMIRHDLRSPLAGILGLAEHAAKQVQEPLAKEVLEAIRDAAKRLHTLVSRNLDLDKIEQGRYVLVPSPVPLAGMLRRLSREAAPLARRRGVAVALWVYGSQGDSKATDEAGPMAVGETALLETMLSNLLTNALEAAPAGSTVTVAAAARNNRAEVTVHNLGVIPEDMRSRFFMKYATSGKPHGMGLGTYIAWRIARLHGGDISFTTSPEEGTRLTVRLPLARLI